jgi:hypothetical protein
MSWGLDRTGEERIGERADNGGEGVMQDILKDGTVLYCTLYVDTGDMYLCRSGG